MSALHVKRGGPPRDSHAPTSLEARALLGGWIPPEEFDDYRIVRPLGRGAMGEVYLAHDRVLERQVAIKFIQRLESEARDRFLTEARAAARIQHPNVMAIHRVGELDGHPYLVTEYVRGQSLAELPLPVPWRQALGFGLGLARGLAAAHRTGVLHRDIKLANAILGEDGDVKLLDFSLAKLVDGGHVGAAESLTAMLRIPAHVDVSVTGLVGTPNYMAPELWRAEPASRSSDIYALGVLLHILCSGRAPLDTPDLAELARRVQIAEPTPLRERVPDVDPRFAAILDRCIRRRPRERYDSGEELRQALESAVSLGQATAGGTGSPYRGLRAFEAEHRENFFGRTAEIKTIVDRLRGRALVVVAGDSGVGKSSLCRAGVLPVLQDGILDPTSTWFTAAVTPGRHPLQALLAVLARHLDISPASVAAAIDDPNDALERDIRRHQAAFRGLVVLVDQLEELITVSDPNEAAGAARLLVRLAAGHPGVRVVATARGDFLTRLAQLPGLGPELPHALYFLLPMSTDGVREAIVGPAQAHSVRFESDELVDRLVTAGIEGSLPLLQFALAELWDARDADSATITNAALERIGGVSGALARHADAAVSRLDVGERRAARGLLLRLVTVDDTRAALTREELAGTPAAHAALDALVAARLVVIREVPGGVVHEIAHEALISGWLTLRIWLDEEREARALRHRLETAAASWDRLGRPSDLLWLARQLTELGRVDTSGLRGHEVAFLSASRVAARRRTLLRRLGVVAVPLIAVAAFAGVRLTERGELARRVDEHQAAASAALAEARALAEAAAGRRAAAFAAFDARERARGEAAWAAALAERPAVLRRYDEAARALEAALQLDADRGDVRDLFADVLFERALLAEAAGDDVEVAALLDRAGLYDVDGRRLARWRAPAAVTIASEPPGAHVTLETYTRAADGRQVRSPPRELGSTPLPTLELPAGSYRLTFAAVGRAPVHLPLLVRRGEALAVRPALPAFERVPAGFVHVPGGRFLYGAAVDEDLRKGFYAAVPLHELTVPPFLIARHETTYGEWITFLEDITPEERAARVPTAGAVQQAPWLAPVDAGGWALHYPRGDRTIVARSGEPFIYPTRTHRAVQDWSRFPVGGVDWEDAQAYLAWLDRSGRVPGARFCSELEWEFAARGADGRSYPTGARIGPDDANFDESQGHAFAAMGPDEVGAHPASESPFGLQDAMGNVFEWTTSALVDGEKIARGGGFLHPALTGAAANRSAFSADFRDASLGVRVCATPRPG